MRAKTEKIAAAVTERFLKIQNAAGGGYTKTEDKFVERYLLRDGETVAEAKKRLREKEEQI